jgi:hypothetical protein
MYYTNTRIVGRKKIGKHRYREDTSDRMKSEPVHVPCDASARGRPTTDRGQRGLH